VFFFFLLGGGVFFRSGLFFTEGVVSGGSGQTVAWTVERQRKKGLQQHIFGGENHRSKAQRSEPERNEHHSG